MHRSPVVDTASTGDLVVPNIFETRATSHPLDPKPQSKQALLVASSVPLVNTPRLLGECCGIE